MEYRKIGNTDLELSVITFEHGSWEAGCGVQQTEMTP